MIDMRANIVETIDYIREKEKINMLTISKMTKIPNPCIYRWYNGIDLPKTKNLCKLLTRFPYVRRILFKVK